MQEPRLQRRLAAIAIADVVGYSRMMGCDEAGTLRAVTERRRSIVEPVVAAHAGRIVKTMGDGFFLEFGSAVDAVEAALELQVQMAQANAGLPEARQIVLRIGINLGEVIVEDGDLFGDGVNIAARLESLAPPGGVLVSGSAYDQVQHRIGARFEDMGPLQLKNIAEPIRAYRVLVDSAPGIAAGPAIERRAPAGAQTSDKPPSIAILPFANLGDDPEQGYFSDGVTEDLITELSRWRVLTVRSRSASFRYRGQALDTAQVARELDVRYLVEGSVRRMGERMRINVQLVDCETGAEVWAEKFDRPAKDLFAVQDEAVETIVSTLVGRVNVSDVARARRKPPSSLAAYDCVVRGNALPWGTPEGMAEAAQLFERAVELDPEYAFAIALLAWMRRAQWFEDSSGSDALLDQAQSLAERAVQVDENQSSSFSVLSQVNLSRRAFDAALQHAEHALVLNPGNQWIIADMGSLQIALGDHEKALQWMARAREVDPYFDQPWYWRGMAQANMLLGRYDAALANFSHAPVSQYRIAALLASCHARLGNSAAAKIHADACVALRPQFSLRLLASKEPFRNPADAAHQLESYRMAGLPE